MGQPHKHAAEIIAWANGETIQFRFMKNPEVWMDANRDSFLFHNDSGVEYRIKPKPEYPTCNISLRGIAQLICHDVGNAENFVLDYQVALRKITNEAIKRAIEDGQVTIVEK